MKLQVPDNIFRGYDLRGIADSELDSPKVELLAKGYSTWLLNRRIYDCVVGYDCRLSSPRIKDEFIEGLTNSGITVYDIGITLSQIAYFAQYFFRTRGMIMITASHNPKEYNGFKLGTGFSETMITEEIQEYKRIVNGGEFIKQFPKGKHIQRDVFDEYAKDLLRRIGPVKKFRVVIDACAATAGLFLPKILRMVGCEVIEQNTNPDGNFPVGTPDPTERDVQERLAEGVLKAHADLGFTYDADGDRVGVVDGEGKLLWNDTLVSIFSKDILDFLPNTKIVYNTLCSKQVDEVIRENGGIPVIWKTGHSFIKAKVKEERAVFGGELSGHFFFLDNFYGHDDGAIATLRLLAYLTRVNKSLHEVVSELPQYISSPEIKLGCPDDIKFKLVSGNIGNEMKKLYPNAAYVEIDGVRMDTEKEMLIVRASQNGPYITVKFEGKTQTSYNLLKNQIRDILRKYAEIDFKVGVNVTALD